MLDLSPYHPYKIKTRFVLMSDNKKNAVSTDFSALTRENPVPGAPAPRD